MADIFAEIDGAEQGTPADFLTLTAPMRAAQLPAQLPTEPSRRRRRAQLPPILIDSISQRFDLLPPSSIPAEKALLGSLMLCEGDEATWSGVDAIIDREDFFQTDHQIIFDVIGQMRFAGVPIDAVTLYDRLSAMHILEDVGGKAYIAEILGSVPDWRRAIQYAKIIKTKSVLRDGISAAFPRSIERGPIEALLDRA